MRKTLLLALLLVLGRSVHSQVTADIGIWGGTSGYLGDIRGNTLIPTTFPVLGAFFRYNFHQRSSIRMMFLSGKAAAEGTFQEQPWSFEKGVQDLSLQVEINYLKYMLGNKKSSFTSYLTAGAGVMYYNHDFRGSEIYQINPKHPDASFDNSESVITPTLPFGMGFKFNVGKKVGLGLEYQMRKLFDDRLDDLNDPLGNSEFDDPDKPDTPTGFNGFNSKIHNNDWIGFLGVHLTFKIYTGSKPCPAYDSKR